VDRAERQLAALGAWPRAGHVVEQPGDLGAAEVRIDDQAGALAYQALGADLLQLLALRRGAPVLPDDRVVDRLAGLPVPDDGGLALVGDADRDQVLERDGGVADRFARHFALRGEDLLRVVLDPARLRKDLRELALRDRLRHAFLVEEDGARAGRSLVEREDVTHGERASLASADAKIRAHAPACFQCRARAPAYAARALRGLQAHRRPLGHRGAPHRHQEPRLR